MSRKPPIIIAAIALTGLGVAVWWRASHNPASAPPPVSTSLHSSTSIPAAKPPVLSPVVTALLSTENVPLAIRLNTLATLGTRLSPDDRNALLKSITHTPLNGLSSSEWYSLANDILQALRRQVPYTPEYTDALIAFWHDQTLDSTLRDYALQQLRYWVADGDPRTVHEQRPEKIALIHKTFLDAVTPGNSSCNLQNTSTGTALLALDEWIPLSAPKSESSSSQLPSIVDFQQLLLAHAGAQSTHRGIRATALQLCARRGILEALPIARSILADSSSEVILRLGAISLLGTLGTSEDRSMLVTFQQQNARDPLLQSVLAKSIRSLGRVSRSSNPSRTPLGLGKTGGPPDNSR